MGSHDAEDANFSRPDRVPDWERVAVFRETFLSLLHPECAAAFRRVGETVYHWAIEDQFAFGRSARSWIARDLGGAAKDLRFLESFLGDVGRSTQLSQLEPEDEPRARLASQVAARVGLAAARLGKAVPAERSATMGLSRPDWRVDEG